MNPALSELELINGLLIKNASSHSDVGLLNGKLGVSIYFFTLASRTKNTRYQETAENLLGEVYNSLGKATVPSDFEDGMAGIAWGLCYLIRNGYVDADADEILSEADDRIYRFLNENTVNLPVSLRRGLLGYLFYYTYRLVCSTGSSDKANVYIFQRVCIDLINQIGQLVEEDKFQSREPALFTVFWDLPVLLMLLARVRALNFCKDKIDRVLDYLTPIVTSLYPSLHSNRLYLLLAMEHVLKEASVPNWRTHAELLGKGISSLKIINNECKSLNILLSDGISGLAFISKKLVALSGNSGLILPEEKVIKKIKESVWWDDIDIYIGMRTNIGLSAGLSGIGLLLLELFKDYKRVKVT